MALYVAVDHVGAPAPLPGEPPSPPCASLHGLHSGPRATDYNTSGRIKHMAYDPVEACLLSIVHDPQVSLRWRKACATLLLDHQRRRGAHDPAPIDINVRGIIGELPAHASVSVDHGSVSARLESQHDFTVKSSRSPISPSDNLEDKTPSIN